MGFPPAGPAEMSSDTTLEGVEDTSGELRCRDASCQKGGRRSIERQAQGLRGRYLTLPSRKCPAGGQCLQLRSRSHSALQWRRRLASTNRRVETLRQWRRLL